jgi:3-oxoacyl-[acyl-carrier protein] reductase
VTRSVLVTGASKGIGAAAAICLAEHGFEAVVHYHADREGAERTGELVRAAGGTPRLIQFDVVDRAGSRAAIEADIAAHGPYYGVVSNAGIHRDRMFPLLRGEDWDAVIRTDLDGFYNVLHPCVLPMIQARRGGRIVAVSSVAGLLGNSGQVNYSAAKAGLIGATKALALELAKRKITVNCIAPGFIEKTGMTENVDAERMAASVPVRRLGKPEEVAALIAYLLSDAAAYVTRQVIAIDGGLS